MSATKNNFSKSISQSKQGVPFSFQLPSFSRNLHSWSCLELELSYLQGLDIGVDEIVLKLKVSFISINIDFHANRSISIDSMLGSKLVCVVKMAGVLPFLYVESWRGAERITDQS